MTTKGTAKLKIDGDEAEITLESINDLIDNKLEIFACENLKVKVTNGGDEPKIMSLSEIAIANWNDNEVIRDFNKGWKLIKKYKKPILFILGCAGLYFGWDWVWHLLKF